MGGGMGLIVNGKMIETEDLGYLLDPEEWDDDVAEHLARLEEITLTDDHWKVIRFVRAYYQDHGMSPEVRRVIRFLVDDMGRQDAAKKHLAKLFPYGYAKQAVKIAGLKRPRNWSIA